MDPLGKQGMRLARVILLGCLALASSAHAAVTTPVLTDIGVEPPPGARLPINAVWRDQDGSNVSLGEAMGGRPTVLVFADFTCTTLCGPILSVATAALSQSDLKPARDYQLVVLGLDPKDTAADAAHMRRQQVGDAPADRAAIFLHAGEADVKRAADAVGYRYVYDAQHDQYAHPAAALILASDGRVSRVLAGLGLTATDLTLALWKPDKGASVRSVSASACFATASIRRRASTIFPSIALWR